MVREVGQLARALTQQRVCLGGSSSPHPGCRVLAQLHRLRLLFGRQGPVGSRGEGGGVLNKRERQSDSGGRRQLVPGKMEAAVIRQQEAVGTRAAGGSWSRAIEASVAGATKAPRHSCPHTAHNSCAHHTHLLGGGQHSSEQDRRQFKQRIAGSGGGLTEDHIRPLEGGSSPQGGVASPRGCGWSGPRLCLC